MKAKSAITTSMNTVKTNDTFLKRTEAYTSSLKSPTVSGTLPTQLGISSMATIHNKYSSISNAMAPEITFLNDNELDEHYRSDYDSLLVNDSKVNSDVSEHQNNYWAIFLICITTI